MDFWISVASAISGMAGTALIYRYGVPKLVDNGGAVYLALEGDEAYDPDEASRINRCKRRAAWGFKFIGLAFLLQLLALLLAR
jgi:hypothetical protein